MDRDWSSEIDTLCHQLTDCYIHSDVAEKVVDLLRRNLTVGKYASLADDELFAAAVTKDMQAINGDPHLYLAHTAKYLPSQDDPVIHDGPRDPRSAGLDGHGFAKAERLPGNVGLIEMRRFFGPDLSGPAAVGLMNYLASADALIIDLRRSGGGEPEMVALLASYLFDSPTQLSSLFFPAEQRSIQFWTLPYVAGERYGATKPVYVLTSRETFSAAEGFSYDLQQHRRATLIGDRTAGGANFHFPMRVANHLFSAVPSGYPLHPVSGANWEGVGVQPDLPVPAEQAFDVAYDLALQHVLTLSAEGPRQVVADQARAALAVLTQGSR